MPYRYVEIMIEDGVSVALAADGRTQQESIDKALERYPFQPSLCVDLSPEIAERFARLAADPSETIVITVSRLRKVVVELLAEGEKIVDQSPQCDQFLSIGLRAQFMDVLPDHIPILLEHEPQDVDGRPSVVFYKEEAETFMTTIIRDGMAQRMHYITSHN